MVDRTEIERKCTKLKKEGVVKLLIKCKTDYQELEKENLELMQDRVRAKQLKVMVDRYREALEVIVDMGGLLTGEDARIMKDEAKQALEGE
jgi:hypothetical protein